MKKADAKRQIRRLCHVWPAATSIAEVAGLSSTDFITWLREQHPHLLRFRSPKTRVEYDIEMWFDEEFGQSGSPVLRG